jgi:formate hydrogenlyase subunit 4
MIVGAELFHILVFPGLLFLVSMGLAGQFVDRRLYARLQNRVGPPWFQPVADFFKLLGKEEVIPEAETEIVAGSFTEYSGHLLAFFRLAIDCEAVVTSSLLAAVFLPFGLGLEPWLGFLVYLGKVLAIIAVLALLRTVFARLRLDQMINFCWRYVAPVAFLQLLADLVLMEFV